MRLNGVYLGLVPLPNPDHYYVERTLRKDVLQTVQPFPCRFMPMVSRGVEYLRIGFDVLLGFLLFFIRFQIELSSL